MEIGLAWGQRPAPAGRSQGSLEASAGRGPLTGAQLCVAGPPWPEAGGGAVGALRGALAAVEGWALPGVPAYCAGMALL